MTAGSTCDSLVTERLLLRRWRPDDVGLFASLNADPEVMEFMPSVLTATESALMIERIESGFDQRGFGLWALEAPGVSPLVGFTGLSVPAFDAHFTPAVEVGWRLARPYWGHGYATEGAKAALRFGFDQVGLTEIVSFTSEVNERSRRVMERLGMTHRPEEDFDHPRLPAGDRLTPHVLYRIDEQAYRRSV